MKTNERKRYFFESDGLNGTMSIRYNDTYNVYQVAAAIYLMEKATYCDVYVANGAGEREYCPKLSFPINRLKKGNSPETT